MKKGMKLLSTVVTLAVVLGSLMIPSKVQAAESKTWYVVYDAGAGRWAASSDNKQTWSSADLASFAAGDSIVVDADGNDVAQIANFTVYQNVKELAFTGKALATVTAPYVEHAYSVNGSTGVVNADVNTADAYGNAVLQINGNVNTFTAHYDNGTPKFAVSGTVGTAYVKWRANWLSNSTPAYNVAAGKLASRNDGAVELQDGEYSTTAPAQAAAAPSQSQAAPLDGKTLDAVPKTGVTPLSQALIFFAIAAIFAVGAISYKKRA